MPFLLLISAALAASAGAPFVRWPEHTINDGFGLTYGFSVGDVDGDGWTDVIAPYSHYVWFNDGAKGWTSKEIPELGDVDFQYGISLGDYNADGLPDISTEPRGAFAFLLRNDGAGEFTKVGSDRFPHAPHAQYAETNGWIDADGDGLLDVFIPAYYGDSGFYANLGPDKKGGYLFDEMALDIGIDLSTTGNLRPEGAQFADVDRDGDADLYVCGELLRNESNPGDFLFEADNGGIEVGFDEGAAFADIDMDGDLDLGVVYQGVFWDSSLPWEAFLIWENLGDSTFVLLGGASTTEDYDITETYNLGMSFADWDNDGDPDLTFSDRFETNQWVEAGTRTFERIDTTAGQTCATPGWFDWDYDGDLDIGLGVWGAEAQFFTNSLYDGTAEEDRNVLRVRPVTDSTVVTAGLDTEFGATVDVHLASDAADVRRRNFVASGHGYLNQSEYTLTFGLEGTKDPIADVAVDFTNPADEGLWRVDKYVNPALGGIDVTALANREVKVFRGGDVEIEGTTHAATTDEGPLLETPGGLWTAAIDDTLAPVADGTWVGLEVAVPEDADPDRGAAIREVLVEGVLGAPVACPEATGNVLLWDVTKDTADLVAGATGAELADNRRVDVPTDFVLEGGHTYRVMALVTDDRTFTPSKSGTWLVVNGALESIPASACDTSWVAKMTPSPKDRAMTVRYRERVVPSTEPVDTGDTGDTGDSGTDDSGTTGDDSGTPPDDSATDDSGTTDGVGDDGSDDSESAGCGCAAGSTRPTGLAPWALILALPLVRRRR